MSQLEETTVVDSAISGAAVGTDVAAADTWFVKAVGIAVVVANAAVGKAANAGDVVVDFTVGSSVAGDNGDCTVDDTNVIADTTVVAAVADDNLFNVEVAVADGTLTVEDANV